MGIARSSLKVWYVTYDMVVKSKAYPDGKKTVRQTVPTLASNAAQAIREVKSFAKQHVLPTTRCANFKAVEKPRASDQEIGR